MTQMLSPYSVCFRFRIKTKSTDIYFDSYKKFLSSFEVQWSKEFSTLFNNFMREYSQKNNSNKFRILKNNTN